MSQFLTDRWLAIALLVIAGVIALLWRRSRAALLMAATLGVTALGGLIPIVDVGFYLTIAAIGILVVMFLVLFATSWWHALTATIAAVVLAFGSGSWATQPIGDLLRDGARQVSSLEVVQPIWLLGLVAIPAILAMSVRSLAGLGPSRRWMVIGLRSLVVALLVLALAEVRLKKAGETTTVLFLVDRSLSIPQEIDPAVAETDSVNKRDRRWRRIKQFINDAVSQRGPGHERDQSGVIAFGKRPRLVLPPGEVPRLNFTEEIIGALDENYTDIAAAVKLALASFPEGGGRRIVLLSDGNENLGSAEEQARVAAANGVQIDVVPLAAGYRNENEVLVQRVEAPAVTEQGGRVPIRVLLRSYNPNIVTGELALRQLSEGESAPVVIDPGPGVIERGPPGVVQLRPGLNSFSFRQSLAGVQRSYTYQAVFTPKSVVASGRMEAGLTGDRVQNNSASTHVLALGRRRVLFVESASNANKSVSDHSQLIEKLQGGGDTKFQISTIHAGELPTNKSDLGVFLSNYDCIVLANVPAEDLTNEQMEMIRSNTHEQGCGLVVIGGPDSFGAGGYQGTAIERALPVDCDIQSVKVAGKGGLVLVMHASEAADGNALQKQIAKLAIQKLSPVDMVGMVYYDGVHRWHIPFNTIGGRRNALYQLVDRMVPGDMPDFDPALQLAYDELTNTSYKLATKHCIVISDGDPSQNNAALLGQMRKAGVTCTTVGIATHGAPETQRMQSMALQTGGRFYSNPPPKAIPAIYIQETRMISQSFIVESRFAPQLRLAAGPADKLPADLPPLYGFVRSSLKQSPLVEMAIEGPSTMDQRYPVLAYWQYGLGKAVAYTSDARSRPGRSTWDQDWVNSEIYRKYWEQVIGWALRGVESGKLGISTEYRDGVVRVTVDARDERNRPLTDLRIKGAVSAPAASGEAPPIELKFTQRSGGQYEAEFKADEAGSYFINAQAIRSATVMKDGKPQVVEESDSIRTGVTVPYSPEFADLESNTSLLKRVAEITGGEVIDEGDKSLSAAAKSGTVFRKTVVASHSPQAVWFWLLLFAGCAFVVDVAARRIAIEPGEFVEKSRQTWDRLRGRHVDKSGDAFLERLKSRKEQVGETLVKEKTTKRFEPAITPTVIPVDDMPRPKPKVEAPPPPAAEGDDAFARLMRAKKKALEERDGESDGPKS